MTEHSYDMMVVGAGPAGITTALYGQRLGLSTVVFGDIPGGNVYMIEKLMNFPGFLGGVPGTQFGVTACQQAREEGAFFTMTRIERLVHGAGDLFLGTDVDGKAYEAPAAVIATGRVPKRLAVSNPQMQGIHFCSICDGPLFRGKDAVLAVVGSDNAAAQHALNLSRVAGRVLLIYRSHTLLMDAAHRDLVERQANIDVLPETEVVSLSGQDLIEAVVTRTEKKETDIPVDGVFLAMGWKPSTGMLEFEVEMTSEGYIKADKDLMSSLPGFFVAGDVRDTDVRQVLTACADGARAATHVLEFLGRRET